MKATRMILASCLLWVSLLSSAPAAELGGISFPDQEPLDGKSLVLNGLGLRKATIFKVKVYVAALYLEARSPDAQAILRSPQLKKIDMRFMHDVDARKMRDAFQEAFEANCPPNCDALSPKLKQIQSWITDIKSGESMQFVFRPGKVEAIVKGKSAGTVEGGMDFSSVFLATWLGKKPPTEELKEGLLGKAH
jgi:hypothetical protein